MRRRTIVTAVELGHHGVSVHTRNGPTFRADRCLVTLPLGVLKSNAVVFRPALPPDKLAAIRRLGAGAFCKVAVCFARPFWPEHLHRFSTVQPPYFEAWSHLPLHPTSSTLVVMTCGKYARHLESLSDRAGREEIVQRLRTNFGPAPVKPIGVRMSRWGRDPFTRGAYTSVAPGSTPADHDALAEPVGDRHDFAGEATKRSHVGTVHGALLSGWREAERILRAMERWVGLKRGGRFC